MVIEPTLDGATGRAPLANAGHYEDTYVKTAMGWRFKGRTYISPQEEAAKLTAVDFSKIVTSPATTPGNSTMCHRPARRAGSSDRRAW